MCRLVPSGIVRTSESTSSSGPECDGQPGLLLDLPAQRVRRALAVLDAAAGQEPAPPQGERRGGPGQQQAALGVAADAVGGDPLALLRRRHAGDAGPAPGPTRQVRRKLPWPGPPAARERKGCAHGHRGRARGHTAPQVRLLPHARPQAVRRARRAADRGRHRLLRGRQDRARGAIGHRVVAARPSWATRASSPSTTVTTPRSPSPRTRRPTAPGTCRTGSSCRRPTSRSPGPPSTPTATG